MIIKIKAVRLCLCISLLGMRHLSHADDGNFDNKKKFIERCILQAPNDMPLLHELNNWKRVINSDTCNEIYDQTISVGVIEITPDDILNDPDNDKISDFSLLSLFSSIENVAINGYELTSVNLFKDFKNLKLLNLSDNKIKSIDCLKDLKNLESLYLSNNSIEELPVLASTKIKHLHIDNNDIKDLSPLANLKALETLNAASNPLQNCSPKDLTDLQSGKYCEDKYAH